MPTSASSANQATLDWPKGSTMNAAISGPIALPILPPTWNSDCAKPCRPPEASRATREASGWNTAEPKPIRQAASTSMPKPCAWPSSTSPTSVLAMPAGSEYGIGQRSVTMPTPGCSSEAVTWKAIVSRPIWTKSRS